MAKRGRVQQPDSQGHRDNTITILQGDKELTFKRPEPYKAWLKITRDRWETYWDSDLSQMTQLVDLPALERLFQYYDQIDRANRAIRKGGSKMLLGTGSKGQQKLHPLIELVIKLEDKVIKLENELGLTPLARQRLGIAFGEASMSIHQLQEFLEKDWDDYDDPRIVEVNQDGTDKTHPEIENNDEKLKDLQNQKIDFETGEIIYEDSDD